MSSATYKARINVPVTPQMHDFVQVLARRQRTTLADVARQALREYLDVQEELIGSRSRMGTRITHQIAEMRDQFLKRQLHDDTVLLAAIIMMQMGHGKDGVRLLTDAAKLACYAAGDIRRVLEGSAEIDERPPSK
jgi:hypothetical protein